MRRHATAAAHKTCRKYDQEEEGGCVVVGQLVSDVQIKVGHLYETSLENRLLFLFIEAKVYR